MPCRRCSECRGCSHHWLENEDFGGDESDDNENPTGNDYVCKHCDVVGNECPVCHGEGYLNLSDTDVSDCKRCDGSGVVIAPRMTFAERSRN